MNIDKILHSYNYVTHQPANSYSKTFFSLSANEEVVVFFLPFCLCFFQQVVCDIDI